MGLSFGGGNEGGGLFEHALGWGGEKLQRPRPFYPPLLAAALPTPLVIL